MEEEDMGKAKQYDKDFKIQAVKLTKKIDSTRTTKELGIPINTLYGCGIQRGTT